jgi:hypothetical protein
VRSKSYQDEGCSQRRILQNSSAFRAKHQRNEVLGLNYAGETSNLSDSSWMVTPTLVR